MQLLANGQSYLTVPSNEIPFSGKIMQILTITWIKLGNTGTRSFIYRCVLAKTIFIHHLKGQKKDHGYAELLRLFHRPFSVYTGKGSYVCMCVCVCVSICIWNHRSILGGCLFSYTYLPCFRDMDSKTSLWLGIINLSRLLGKWALGISLATPALEL